MVSAVQSLRRCAAVLRALLCGIVLLTQLQIGVYFGFQRAALGLGQTERGPVAAQPYTIIYNEEGGGYSETCADSDGKLREEVPEGKGGSTACQQGENNGPGGEGRQFRDDPSQTIR